MKKVTLLLSVIISICINTSAANFEKDTIQTSGGPLVITFIGHGSLEFEFAAKKIYVDPVSMQADFSAFPKADIILVTHQHGDHFDKAAIQKLATDNTKVVLTKKCSEDAGNIKNTSIMSNGENATIENIKIEAVAAYNINKTFHPKGEGNGYVITFGNKKVYVAGDTENIPEMKSLKNIDIAFLPMNLPYTMTPEMVADAATTIMPKILYPYHFGNTDTNKLIELLKDKKNIEVRIRKMS
jgi:L-ascorbate metabolism protein UlaG (beta-lactamase superfamily)